MNTQRMLVDISSGNRMYAEDIQYGSNIYTEVFRGGLGITGSTNTGVFKILGLTVNGNNIQFNKGTVLIYYNGTSSSTIVDSDQIAVCRYKGNVVSFAVGSSINLYVGYNETSRVNERGSNYVAYIDFFFQTTSFSGSKLTLNIPANLTVTELVKQYGWNYPVNDSFTIDLIETPIDAQDILTGGSVGTGQLANYCVTSDRIANGAVGTDQLNVSEVNGMFFDYTISNISKFGTVFNDILSRGSYKVRILAGEYNITKSYNLGNTSSNNKVDIYCDPGVKITLYSSPDNAYGLTVTNDGGSGEANLYGGEFLNIWTSSKNISYPNAIINGFNSVSNALILNPLIINTVTGNLYAIRNSSNINNCKLYITESNYSTLQQNKKSVFFGECNNISNITIPKPALSQGKRKEIYVFSGCMNITNVNIESYESINTISYFFTCTNISNIQINITGKFLSQGQNTCFFFNCIDVSNVRIFAENYYIKTNVEPPIVLFLSCNNIINCSITFNTVPDPDSFAMFTIMNLCNKVNGNYINNPGFIFTVMKKCMGVINNTVTPVTVSADTVYSGCYSSMDVNSEYACANTPSGGFNFSGQLKT